jgi:hypothetical protein
MFGRGMMTREVCASLPSSFISVQISLRCPQFSPSLTHIIHVAACGQDHFLEEIGGSFAGAKASEQGKIRFAVHYGI